MNRRARLALLALVPLTALSLPGARRAGAIDCPGIGPPAGLGAAIEEHYFGDPVPHVHLRWTPPDDDIQYTRFVGYRVERRDDTNGTGGNWVTIAAPPSLRYSYQEDWWNFLGDWTEPGSPCDDLCANPGRTYSYRVATLWAYTTSACDGHDGGATKETYSEEVQVTIPGDPPEEPGMPRNVVAVAEPKRPRVEITWEHPDTGAPDAYVVERAAVPEAPPGAKPHRADLDLVWKRIARIESPDPKKPVNVLRLLDRRADPRTIYEYRVAAEIDSVVSDFSPSDRALTPGRCGASKWGIWEGTWTYDDAPLVLHVPAPGLWPPRVTDPQCAVPAACPISESVYASVGLLSRHGSRRKAKTVASVVNGRTYLQVDGTPLARNVVGSVALDMERGDPFSEHAWRRATAKLRFGKFRDETVLTRDPADLGVTALCGVIASGAKGVEVKPGQPVAFVFRAVALGPNPLYANQVQVHLTVEGGLFAGAAAGQRTRLLNDPAGLNVAVFDVGALGPASAAKSEEASLVVTAVSPSDAPERQLRVTARLVRLALGDTVFFPEDAPFAEVRVRVPPPAKGR